MRGVRKPTWCSDPPDGWKEQSAQVTQSLLSGESVQEHEKLLASSEVTSFTYYTTTIPDEAN